MKSQLEGLGFRIPVLRKSTKPIQGGDFSGGEGLDSPVEEEHKAEEGHDEAGGNETQACEFKRFRV